MAFDITSKANIPFKQALGKAHTSNTRDPANEPFASKALVLGQYTWAETIHPVSPSDISNTGIVSEIVTLTLNAVSGTIVSGKPTSYYATITGSIPTSLVGKINPLTGNIYTIGDRVGNIIPNYVGDNYRPKLYKTGIETPPLDASDWFLDCASGIITQESDVTASMIDYSTGGTLQCYIYIGKNISESISSNISATTITFYDHQVIGAGIVGVIDGINDTFTLDTAPSGNSLHVYHNGLCLRNGAHYSLSGATITMDIDSIPDIGDFLEVSYRV